MLERKKAIVIGGSIAGLGAAKALSESFEHVLVLEQDDPPAADHARRYVPQSAYPHLLTRGGVIAAEQIFPRFGEDMQHSPEITATDETGEVSFVLHGVLVRKVPTESTVYPQTRVRLEHYFYKQVTQIPNVEIRHHVRVHGLIWDEKHTEVVGVTLTTGERLLADLVVDASGRSSRLSNWLEEAGYSKPHTDVIHLNLAYACRIFHSRPGMESPVGTRFEQDEPNKKARTGAMIPIENHRWFIFLCGYHGDHPPTDPEGFLNFAKSLPTQTLAHSIETLEPEGNILGYVFKEAVWHRFDQLERQPSGILAVGDAVCSVNPKFGQGMSLALQQVSVLQTLLRTNVSKANLAHRFYKKTRPFIDSAWTAGAGEDFLMPETTGDKPKNLKILQAYFAWLVNAASYDPRMASAFLKVLILARRANSLLAPHIILLVLFDHFVREKLLGQQPQTVR